VHAWFIMLSSKRLIVAILIRHSVNALTIPSLKRTELNTSMLFSKPAFDSGTRGNKRRGSLTNKSTDRNKRWFQKRSSGVQTKGRGKRAPRWEVEGDSLFLLVKEEEQQQQVQGRKIENNLKTTEEILESVCFDSKQINNPTTFQKQKTPKQQKVYKNYKNNVENPTKKSPPPHMMWGECSVGPVLKSRLIAASFQNATPIQAAAFSIISSPKRPNVVIASPTGSGKTLAYLLPLMSITKRRMTTSKKTSDDDGGGGGSIMIVTPTIELATQIQSVVDKLWSKEEDNGNSAMCVVTNQQQHNSNDEESTMPSEEEQYEVLLEKMKKCTIIAGTPRSLNNVISYCQRCNDNATVQQSILSNFQFVILDEADRLLKTERMARILEERKQKQQQFDEDDNNQELAWQESSLRQQRKRPLRGMLQKNKKNYKPTQTEVLLSSLSKMNFTLDVNIPSRSSSTKSYNYLKKIQLICASATVGRTLRRQIQDLTNAPSIDKGSTLVCGEGDGRVGKRGDVRKSSLLPSSIRHSYALLDVTTVNENNVTGGSSVTMKEEGEDVLEMEALWNVLQKLPPAPCLIFPGKLNGGVAALYDFFYSTKNCTCVHSFLRQGSNDLEEDCKSLQLPLLKSENMDKYESWEQTPIYTVKERFARGLDIPNIYYAILSTPPTSAAAYTHLAGRTGRIGRGGVAITLVRNEKEANRLSGISNALGIRFNSFVGE